MRLPTVNGLAPTVPEPRNRSVIGAWADTYVHRSVSWSNSEIGLRTVVYTHGFNGEPRSDGPCVRLIDGHLGEGIEGYKTCEELLRIELPRLCVVLIRDAVAECMEVAETWAVDE